MPGRFSTAVEGHYTPGDEFPFTYETLTDPISKKRDGWLVRCRQQNSCPKIMHWDSGTGLAGKKLARGHRPVNQKRRADPRQCPALLFHRHAAWTHGQTRSRHVPTVTNPLSYQETQRALIVALHAWVTKDVPPPPTRYPRASDGTLSRRCRRPSRDFRIFPACATRANQTIISSTIITCSRRSM